jgi:hypothetical protein
MKAKAQTTVTTNETLSPLELAHLSAALVQSGIVEKNSAGFHIQADSLSYLEKCREALRLKKRMVEQAEEDQREKRQYDFIASFNGSPVPVDKIVTFCQAQRIKPSAAELKTILESRPFESLTKAKQTQAIFLVLTNKTRTIQTERVNRPWFDVSSGSRTRHAPPISERRAWIQSGVPNGKDAPPCKDAGYIIDLVEMAMKARASEAGKEGVTRRKPRAPKGDDAKFEKKRRNQAGEYTKQ